MNNTSLRLLGCVAAVVIVGSGWRVAVGEPQSPVKIGEGSIKMGDGSVKAGMGGRPAMLPDAKIDLLVLRVEKLEAENVALKKQVAQLESGVQKNTSDMTAAKLLLVGLDKSVGQLSKDFKSHTHEIAFGFSNPATVTNSPSNILVPWISAGQLKSGAVFQTKPPLQK